MLREAFGGPYALTAFFAMNAAQAWADEHHSGEPVSYVFEYGDTDQSQLLRTLRLLKVEGAFNVTFMAKQWKEGSEIRHHYAFQACDFMAYETAKAARALLEQDAREGRMTSEMKSRKSLMQVAPKESDITWRFIDSGLLGEMCRRLRVKRRRR